MKNINFKPLLGAVAALLLFAAFSLPARAEGSLVAPVDLTNIAAAANGGRVLSATSTLSDDPAFKASNLIDGQVYNAGTKTGSEGWASDKFDPINMDYVTFCFKNTETKLLGRLVFDPCTSLNPERWAKDIEVQVSTDSEDGPYSPVAEITLKRAAERQGFSILPVKAKYVRLMFRSNWGSDRSVALGEVEMYEAIDTSDEVGGVIGRLEESIRDLESYAKTQSDIRDSGGGRAMSAPVPAPSTHDIHPVSTGAKGAAALDSGAAVDIAASRNGGGIVDFSSIFNNDQAYGPNNLIDGQNYDNAADKGTYGWSSQGFVPGKEFVTIGFRDDRTHVIKKLVLNPASNQLSQRWASRVDVQVTSGSAKEGPYRTVASFNILQEPTNQDFELNPVEAKYVKFVFTANGPGNPLPLGDPNVSSDRSVSLGEIEIYELLSDSGTLPALIGRFNQVLVDMKNLRHTGLIADGPAAPRVAAAPAEAVVQAPAAEVPPVVAVAPPPVVSAPAAPANEMASLPPAAEPAAAPAPAVAAPAVGTKPAAAPQPAPAAPAETAHTAAAPAAATPSAKPAAPALTTAPAPHKAAPKPVSAAAANKAMAGLRWVDIVR